MESNSIRLGAIYILIMVEEEPGSDTNIKQLCVLMMISH